MKPPQKQHIHHIIFICLLMVVGWGQMGPISYISPGIQIGLNSNEGIFFGFQTSIGFKVSDKIYDKSSDFLFIPSMCFGIKYYPRKYSEKYIDFQSTYIKSGPSIDDIGLPIGIGIGKNFSKNKSNFRLKGYTWLLTSFTIDYEIKQKSVNFSLIPILPINRELGEMYFFLLIGILSGFKYF